MFRRLLREYFSLSRGERRGLQVLLLLIILGLAFRGFLPRLVQLRDKDLTAAEQEFAAFQDSLHRMDFHPPGTDRLPSAELFPFDPNIAGLDELVRLGIPSRTARILINYRAAGGEFACDSDLLRVYGMQPELFSRLKPYIRMEQKGGPDAPPGGSATAAPGPGEWSTVPGTQSHALHGKGTEAFELNTADSLQLISVYGIGPIFAHRIIRYRDLLGGFCRLDQLLEVYGLGPLQMESLARCSYIDTSRLRKLDLNRLDAGYLSKHPYLDQYHADALVFYREQTGGFRYPAQVIENRLLPDSVFLRIFPYLYAGR